MQKDWQAPGIGINRSKFNRSHGHKTTFDVDRLVPILCEEVLPGDTVNASTSAFMRMATPIYPILDNMQSTIHWFFVPMRLVWDNAEQFFGEDLVGGDGNAPAKPIRTTIANTGAQAGSLEDYLGIPVGVPLLEYDELPLRAYYEIYNQWYRDQNLQELFPIEKGDAINDWGVLGGDFIISPQLLNRNKKHDYFTSCLPWPQKGPDISLPLINPTVDPANTELWNTTTGVEGVQLFAGTDPGNGQNDVLALNAGAGGALSPNAEGWNDNAGTLNQLRIAFAVQRQFERDARGGTRYPEVIMSHFRVRSPDARLQRPEFLGSNRTNVNITPVATTFEAAGAADAGRTVGDLGAMATVSFGGQHAFVKSFVEHGYLMGILSVTADITYQQGLHRSWQRRNRFQYFWPAFAGIGEQPVNTREIWAGDSNGQAPGETFGYQERFAEYRFAHSRISGLFRSNDPQPLDAWHLSQNFTAQPLLNSTFIQSTTPLDRTLAVPSEPDFIADFYFHQTWVRPIPLYGIPGNIDRF